MYYRKQRRGQDVDVVGSRQIRRRLNQRRRLCLKRSQAHQVHRSACVSAIVTLWLAFYHPRVVKNCVALRNIVRTPCKRSFTNFTCSCSLFPQILRHRLSYGPVPNLISMAQSHAVSTLGSEGRVSLRRHVTQGRLSEANGFQPY